MNAQSPYYDSAYPSTQTRGNPVGPISNSNVNNNSSNNSNPSSQFATAAAAAAGPALSSFFAPAGPSPQVFGLSPQAFQQFTPNDPLFQAGLQTGIRAVQTQAAGAVAGYAPGASQLWNSLRIKFAVSNEYVIEKLKVVAFPFRKTSRVWSDMELRGGSSNDHLSDSTSAFGMGPLDQIQRSDSVSAGMNKQNQEDIMPVHDYSAPDLYIPVMSFVTYVLLVGLSKGTMNSAEFSPEILLDTFGSSIGTQGFEIAVMKFGFYYMAPAMAQQSTSLAISYVDMAAYTGYKYVMVSICLIVGLLFPSIYTLCLIYASCCASFFLYRIMQHAVPKPGNDQSYGHKRRSYFILVCAILQALTIWYLAYSREMGWGITEMTGIFRSSSSISSTATTTGASLPPSISATIKQDATDSLSKGLDEDD